MNTKYTNERNTLILIALLKAHGIKKIIASPGTTNINFVASVQNDPFFELYSSADERSAAYMACGMAAESGEAVVLSCTGATASRNYIPALTEAFYRRLPILAVTSTQFSGRIGQMIPQVLDRTQQLNDMVVLSEQIPNVQTDEEAWACNTKINTAILALFQHGGGPVHINLETTYNKEFSVSSLPEERVIQFYKSITDFPQIPKGRICIFVGAHSVWKDDLLNAINSFCKKYNAVVLCDQTSNYRGPYRICYSILTNQIYYSSPCKNIDLLIHIGEISGAYPRFAVKEVWRVDPDGIVRDTFKKLTKIFEMDEYTFFSSFTEHKESQIGKPQIEEWRQEILKCEEAVGELPFSNIWIAKEVAQLLPENSILHLGILNSLRSWNLVETPKTISGFANTGGFGIDGILSTAIGASLAAREKLVFCVIGDLAFFYDMNSLGNRHLGNNLRILLVNNGKGTEFKNFNHPGALFGDDADGFIAAAGHYGNQSKILVKHYAEDLGFEYLTAANKNEFLEKVNHFTTQKITDKPILFEVFTSSEDESNALKKTYTCITETQNGTKTLVKNFLGENGIRAIRKMIGK